MEKLDGIASKRSRLVMGLISGTSADGVDAALVRVRGCGEDSSVELVDWSTFAFEPELRRDVLALAGGKSCRAEEIAEIDFRLGEAFAEAALSLCSKAGVDVGDLDAIGSHGQTVFHRGAAGRADSRDHGGGSGSVPCTLQLGNPSIVAQRTRVLTVADFRSRDIAAGGEGAPLVPLADFVLFSSKKLSRCVVNVGGIANVTFLPRGCSRDEVVAFDTGPGNMVLDALACAFSGGSAARDDGGRLALEGKPDKRLLAVLLGHEYFRLPPPKSTGRETFGEHYARDLMRQAARLDLSEADVMRTAVSLTATTIAEACRVHFPRSAGARRTALQTLRRLIEGGRFADQVVVGGGGVHNAALMQELRRELKPVEVVTCDELGVPSDAKEAMAFAILANETICGRPGNLPGATGASEAVVLGVIAP